MFGKIIGWLRGLDLEKVSKISEVITGISMLFVTIVLGLVAINQDARNEAIQKAQLEIASSTKTMTEIQTQVQGAMRDLTALQTKIQEEMVRQSRVDMMSKACSVIVLNEERKYSCTKKAYVTWIKEHAKDEDIPEDVLAFGLEKQGGSTRNEIDQANVNNAPVEMLKKIADRPEANAAVAANNILNGRYVVVVVSSNNENEIRKIVERINSQFKEDVPHSLRGKVLYPGNAWGVEVTIASRWTPDADKEDYVFSLEEARAVRDAVKNNYSRYQDCYITRFTG